MAAELFDVRTGRHGGRVPAPRDKHGVMTAAVIDSRDFISARHRAETGI